MERCERKILLGCRLLEVPNKVILEWRSTSVEGDDAASNSIPWARGPAGRTQLRALSARADAPGPNWPCLPTDRYVVRPLATRLRSRTRVLQPNSPEAQRQSDRWRLAETISAVAVATRRPLRTPARWPIEQSPPHQLPHRSRGRGGDRASKRLAPHRIPTAKSRDCFCFTRTLIFSA